MELDWTQLLRDAGNDPVAVGNVWTLASVHEPGNEGLRLRIEAQGRAARKSHDREAAKAQAAAAADGAAAKAPMPVTAPVAVPVAVPGTEPSAQPVTPVPAESAVDADGPAAASGYAPEEEERDFVRDVARSVKARMELELTRDQALAALAVWREHVAVDGQAWHYVRSPGWTGATLGAWLCARYPALTRPVRLAEDSVVWDLAGAGTSVMRVLGWTLPERCPAEGQTIAAYDVTAQYLAAMRSVRLGDGEPITIPADQDGVDLVEMVKRPGYLVLDEPPDLSGLPAHVGAAFARLDAGSILPMPLAGYLVRDHGVALAWSQLIVWDRTTKNGREVNAYGPRLSRVAEEISENRDRLRALAATDPQHPAHYALALLKDVYARFSAGFMRSDQHNTSAYLRPDWADMIAATGSANSLRALDKAVAGGWEPIGQSADTVWFVLDVAPEHVPEVLPAGLELSDRPGKWHLNRWGRATARLVQVFKLGHPNLISKALADINQTRIEEDQ